MTRAWSVVIPPATEVISVAELMTHLRLDDASSELTYLASLIKAAREALEEATWRAFITQTIELRDSCFQDEFELPRPPAIAITDVKYYNSSGVLRTVDRSIYSLDTFSEPSVLRLAYNQVWPSDCRGEEGDVRVRYTAGYGGQEDVPESLRMAVRHLAAAWWENRSGETAELPKLWRLINPYKLLPVV